MANIITIGGIKGGSGKTTLATNILVELSRNYSDVLLIDADDQETASDFTEIRAGTLEDVGYTAIRLSGQHVRREALKMADKYSHIVIDTGGAILLLKEPLLAIASVYVVPFNPRSYDIWTLEKVEHLVEEMLPANPKLKAVTLLNRADPKGSDNIQAGKLLEESEVLMHYEDTIGNRKAFSHAAAVGLGICENTPTDRKAVKEFLGFYNFILTLL